TAIGLSQVMDDISWGKVVLSPVQIQHLVNGYFGWAGSQILSLTDALVTRPAFDMPEPPTKRLSDYVLLKRFMKEQPRRNTKYATEFYGQLEEVRSIYGDIRQMRKFGETEKALLKAQKDGAKLRTRKYLNKMSRKLSSINKQMSKVRRSRMDSDLKRKKLERLQILKNRLTKLAVTKTSKLFR
ncbi:MAG: hypothetical protein KAS32_01890, partial [Candidatus Peribacteraceae bacterium]|nr:hypothetical protein [Candidatus Peribacteraceae bacterium]